MDETDLLTKQEMHETIETSLSAAFGSGVVTFGQLEELGKVREFYNDVRSLTTVATILLDNISWRFSPEANNKENIALIKQVTKEYTERLDALTADVQSEEQKSLSERTMDFINKMLTNLTKGNDDLDKEQNFKTEGGKKYYASDYLYVPDRNKPSTWKLRIADGGTGKVTIAQLGRAAAAFSAGGFRGNQVELPSGESSRIKAKLRAKYKSLGVKEEDMPESIRKEIGEEEDTFTILKQADGTYRWIAIHTNNFQDEVEDILSKESHAKFVDMVEKGEAEYPELWHWHIPGTQWGQADMLAFDNDTGMMVSSGYVLKGHEAEAEALSNMPYAVGVSHGMPRTSVRRDPDDPRVITEYITKEISDLPLVQAANRLTHFVTTKEEVMPIPAKKKDYLKSVGVPDEVIDSIEETMKKSSDEAQKEGIMSKEAEETTEAVAETTTEAVTEKPTEDSNATEVGESTEDKAEASEDKESKGLTKEDIASAVADSIKLALEPITKTLKEIGERQDTLEKELKESKEEAKVEKEKLQMTPPSSLASMIARQLTVSDSPETILRKNSTLTKDAPEETPADEGQTLISTQSPVLNKVITNIIGAGKSTPTQ